MKSTILLFAVSVVLLVSCSSQKEGRKQTTTMEKKIHSPAELDASDWKLVKIKMGEKMETLTDSRAFMRFQTAQGSAAGNGSCNRFGAKISIDKDSIHFTDIFSTKMFCEGVQATENSFLEALGKVDHFEINDGQLHLFQSTNLLLVLTPFKSDKN